VLAGRVFAVKGDLTYRWRVVRVQNELIGRDAELTAVHEFLQMPQERTSALLCEGEAGIGKTSLWKAGLQFAEASGYRVLSSAPTEAEAGLPHSVLGDLLDPVSEEALASLADPLRRALAVALFRAPAEQSPTDRLAVSTAFLRVLRSLAVERPVLVALDDIQWCDPASMRVLAFVFHRTDREQVKLLATARVLSSNEAGEALRKSVGDGQFQRLAIGPLPLDAIDDLLLQRLERPLRRPELDQVYAVSGGNPFFALEIGRLILEHPASVKAGGPIPVPQSLAAAIEDRIQKLPRETRDSLVALAALSHPDEALLRRVGVKGFGAALAAGVVESSQGRLRFTHPLLGSVIYSTADPTLRRKWHSKLSAVVNDPEERARHLALAATQQDADVAEALERAAESANLRGAPDAAASLAQQAAELTPPELAPEVQRRRIKTAEYRMRAGDIPAARALLEDVLRSSLVGKRPAEALRLMGTLAVGGQSLLEGEQFLAEALSLAGDDEYAQALIERDLVRVLSQCGRLQEASDHSAQLSEIAARRADPALLVLASRFRAVSQTRLVGTVSPEVRAMAVGLAEDRVSQPLDDNAGGLHPFQDWAVLLKMCDDFGHARILLKRGLELTEGRDESLRAPLFFHLAEIECWAGDWLLAAVYAHECERSVIHSGHRSYGRLTLVAKAMLSCYRGELDQARAAGQEALAISTTVGDEAFRRRALGILGATELAAGDAVAANGYFETLRAGGNDQGYRGIVRSEGDEVEALIALGRLSDTGAVMRRLTAFADPWQRAIGGRCAGLIAAVEGDVERSSREIERALRAHSELPMPLERARTLLTSGSILRRAKSKRAAGERAGEAMQIFKSLGAKVWIKRAEDELSRISPGLVAIDALTPTESRVAELVANGRTNKEAAAELFLSVKTVEANLSRIYAKLRVRSRSELVARLAARR
jgi:DNA-binding CsgD family transcriptional regulator